jgi:hypothetical protein
MHRAILSIAFFTMLSLPASAVDRASDAADFREYVAVCADNTDERGVDGCIADQVSGLDSYLGDILSETAQSLSAADEKRLYASQTAFEAYRKAACLYYVGATGRHDRRTELFCELRLTSQRVADILEGADFLSWEQ